MAISIARFSISRFPDWGSFSVLGSSVFGFRFSSCPVAEVSQVSKVKEIPLGNLATWQPGNSKTEEPRNLKPRNQPFRLLSTSPQRAGSRARGFFGLGRAVPPQPSPAAAGRRGERGRGERPRPTFGAGAPGLGLRGGQDWALGRQDWASPGFGLRPGLEGLGKPLPAQSFNPLTLNPAPRGPR